MILLTIDEIQMLHHKLIAKTGGMDGLRDLGLLESAVYGASGGFGDTEQYPTLEEKSARLAYAIVNNHPFVDGNKRIGVLVMLVTLKLNCIILRHTQEELIALGLSIAGGSFDYHNIYSWILQHK